MKSPIVIRRASHVGSILLFAWALSACPVNKAPGDTVQTPSVAQMQTAEKRVDRLEIAIASKDDRLVGFEEALFARDAIIEAQSKKIDSVLEILGANGHAAIDGSNSLGTIAQLETELHELGRHLAVLGDDGARTSVALQKLTSEVATLHVPLAVGGARQG